MDVIEIIINKLDKLEAEIKKLKSLELNRTSRLNVGLTGAAAGVDNIYADGNITASGYLKSQLDGSSYGVFLGQDTQFYRSAANIIQTPDTLIVDGDLYTVTWTDYSGTSTINGWAAGFTKNIWYKKIGKLVFVGFDISGTSNAAATNFTVPYTRVANGSVAEVIIRAYDNNVAAAGLMVLPASSNRVDLYKDPGGGAFLNTGTKLTRGQFWYQTA